SGSFSPGQRKCIRKSFTPVLIELWVLKIRRLRIISSLQEPGSGRLSHVNWAHDPVSSGFSLLVQCLLPLATRAGTGARRLDSAGRHSQAQESQTPIDPLGSPPVAELRRFWSKRACW